jgi:DNA adenine methylase
MNVATDAPTRPVLRYHGGKWRLAPWIISQFPPHRIYVEPYGGAMSVLLRKPRCYAEIYNDLDGEIVNLFRVLRNPTQARELVRLVRLTPYAREESELSHLVDGDPVEQARRTLLRSFAGHGSAAFLDESPTGFRNNATRLGTIPAHDWRGQPRALEMIAERLRGVVIESRPALTLIAAFDSTDTLFYVDPPYPISTRGGRHHYRHEMTDDEHRELAEVLHQVTGMAIISGYECDLYDELYPQWERVTRSARADGALRRLEVLWLSPRVTERRLPLFNLR